MSEKSGICWKLLITQRNRRTLNLDVKWDDVRYAEMRKWRVGILSMENSINFYKKSSLWKLCKWKYQVFPLKTNFECGKYAEFSKKFYHESSLFQHHQCWQPLISSYVTTSTDLHANETLGCGRMTTWNFLIFHPISLMHLRVTWFVNFWYHTESVLWRFVFNENQFTLDS